MKPFSNHFYFYTLRLALVLSLITAPVLTQRASAGEEEDRKAALGILSRVKDILHEKLDRTDAPAHYRDAVLLFDKMQDDLKQKISQSPKKVGPLIHEALNNIPLMSHFHFIKLKKKATLGFSIQPLSDQKALITQVEPGSTAAYFGLKPGQIIRTIDGQSASERMKKGFSEQGQYGKHVLELEKSLEAKVTLTALPLPSPLPSKEPFFGFSGEFEWDASRNRFGGFRITQVLAGSEAEKSGLQVGDEISLWNGQVPDRPLVQKEKYKAGDTLLIRVDSRKIPLNPTQASKKGYFGFDGEALLTGGFKVDAVIPNSPAAEGGLLPGDLILTANGQPYTRKQKVLDGGLFEFEIQRSGKTIFLSLEASSRSRFEQTRVTSIKRGGTEAVLLRVPDFSENYDPKLVHHAFESARDGKLLIVDLRGNPGGRPEHLLSYLLQPEAVCMHCVGRERNHSDRNGFLNDTALRRLEEDVLKTLGDLPFGSRFTDLLRDALPYRPPFANQRTLADRYSVIAESACQNCKARGFPDSKPEHLACRQDTKLRFSSVKGSLEWLFGFKGSKSRLALVRRRMAEFQNLLEEFSLECGSPDPNPGVAQDRFLAHARKLHAWFEETKNEAEELLKAEAHQPICQVETLGPQLKQLKTNWVEKIAHVPFPFLGKVAFLVDKNTSCAAEVCALDPIDYLAAGSKESVFPQAVAVIGSTEGRAQGAGEKKISSTLLGDFVLGFPEFDVHSGATQTRIEGTGVKGMPVDEALEPEWIDGKRVDRQIIQALEWGKPAMHSSGTSAH